MIRILVADDQPAFRAGVRALLEDMPDAAVIGEATDGDQALRLVRKLKPDVVLLDVSLHGKNALEVAAAIARTRPKTRTLFVSTDTADESVRRALAAGAAGYVLRSSNRSALQAAVGTAARGETWLPPEVPKRAAAASARGEEPKGPAQLLTARQLEVLKLVAQGLSTKEIAKKLGLSVKTIDSHRTDLMQRLGVHGVASLVHYAICSGLVRCSLPAEAANEVVRQRAW